MAAFEYDSMFTPTLESHPIPPERTHRVLIRPDNSYATNTLLWWVEFLAKPFYHSFRPLPLHHSAKQLNSLHFFQSAIKM